MKTLTLFAITALIALTSSCTLKEVINPDGSIKVGNTSDTDNNSGTNTGTGNNNGLGTTTGTTTNSNSTQPISRGSVWTYTLVEFGGVLDNYTYTMTGNLEAEGPTIYYAYSIASKILPTELAYYANNDHLYISREYHNFGSDRHLVDIPYLKDDAAIGEVWKGTAFPSNLSGYDAQYVCKLIEKGITKEVNGKSYANVYHTHVDLIYSYTGGVDATQVLDSYDYYITSGVGLIERDETIAGADAGKLILTAYNIK